MTQSPEAAKEPVGTRRLNIALLPDHRAAEQLEDLAQTVRGSSPSFRISPPLTPHMTMFMGLFPDNVTPTLDATLALLRNDPITSCSAIGIALTANGYTEVSYEKTAQLVTLQGRILQDVARAGVAAGATPDAHLSPAEARNLKEFGYEFVNDQLRPHITLGRFDPQAPITFPPLDRDSLRFRPSRIAVSLADNFGAATQIVTAFRI